MPWYRCSKYKYMNAQKQVINLVCNMCTQCNMPSARMLYLNNLDLIIWTPMDQHAEYRQYLRSGNSHTQKISNLPIYLHLSLSDILATSYFNPIPIMLLNINIHHHSFAHFIFNDMLFPKTYIFATINVCIARMQDTLLPLFLSILAKKLRKNIVWNQY